MTPWSLPAARQFLDEAAPLAWRGGAVVGTDASTPPGLASRLVSHLRDDVALEILEPGSGDLPLAVLGEACGRPGCPMAEVLASGRSFVIETGRLGPADLARWGHALTEFAAGHQRIDQGGAIFFLGEVKAPGLARLDWTRRLRHVDAMIWAEYAVPAGRSELVQRLAVELAVGLCGWRLDLVADLVTQREEDILAPMGWLQRRAEDAIATPATFGASPFACPLHLLARGDLDALRLRIWRAQLSVLFPWIEGHRQRLVDRHARHLYIDEHLEALGVTAVHDIELGGLRRQLSRVLSRDEAEQVAALAKLRNDLAHRKPISPADFALARRMRAED